MSTQLVTDNFTRANENPLSQGGNWHTVTGAGAPQVVSNLCEPSVTTRCASYYDAGIAWPTDQYAETKLTSDTNSVSFLGPLVRQATGADTCYEVVAEGPLNATGVLFLVKRIAGAQTTLHTATVTLAANDIIRLTVTGSVLTVQQNGTTLSAFTTTDAAIASGKPGIVIQSTVIANVTCALWNAGNTLTGIPNSLMTMGAGT